MAGFSEQTLQKKLLELNNTLPSIQTLSLWLIHHRKHSKAIVELWLKEVRHERDPKRLLTLVYLANDVIQNSRKRWPMFREQYQNVLITGLSHVARHTDTNTLRNVKRVLDVWRERSVYDDEFLTKLTYAITSNLTRDMLALFNEGPSKTPPRPQDQTKTKTGGSSNASSTPTFSSSTPSSSSTTTFSKPKGYSFGSPRTPPLGGELPLNFLRTPEDEEEDKDEKAGTTEQAKTKDEVELSLDPAASTDLLNSLKELEQAPSADVRTREQIAQFPPDIADVTKLKNIKNKEEADRFSTQIAQADTILTEYNARLNEELEKRRDTLVKLERFVEAHKRRIEEETKELTNWKEKLAKLSNDRQQLLVHIQSLPDLSKLPDPTKLPPLPSVGDLFTS